MIKHPAFRVASFADIDPDIVTELAQWLEEYATLCPFARLIEDFEIVGSYARGTAELHSDLDINLATGTRENLNAARLAIQSDKQKTRAAVLYRNSMMRRFGVRLELMIEHPAVKSLSSKRCYSMREARWYGTETRRMDILPSGDVVERARPQIRQPKLTEFVIDFETGEQRIFNPKTDDPYASLLPKYQRLYGGKLLRYGHTPETAHMRVD